MKSRALLAALPLLGASCATHGPHRVTDLASGHVYYTKELRRGLTTGNIYLWDAKTGAKVTIQSSQVEEITEAQYQQGLAK